MRGREGANKRACAMCRYDLSGLPGCSRRCPECGAVIGEIRGRHARLRCYLLYTITVAVVTSTVSIAAQDNTIGKRIAVVVWLIGLLIVPLSIAIETCVLSRSRLILGLMVAVGCVPLYLIVSWLVVVAVLLGGSLMS
jgi:hypothetical protein